MTEVPFLSLRGKLSLNGKSYRELIAESQREINAATVQLPLKMDFKDHLVEIGSRAIEMVPMQLLVYAAFLREKVLRCRYPEPDSCLECTDCFPTLVDLSSKRALDEMAEDYRRIYGFKSSRMDDFLRKWPEGMDVEAFRQQLSKINRTLREGLEDDTLLPFYVVTTVGKYGSKTHGVKIGLDLKEYHARILGALVHDIGKFIQRAQDCPTRKNHSRWGEEWFEKFLAEKLSSIFNEKEKGFIRSAIGSHHEHEKYVSLADSISAGMDRINVEDEEKGDPFSDRLISIFSKVSISEKPKMEKYHQLVPVPLVYPDLKEDRS